MAPEISLILITAAGLGFLHTILGPDHYIPFIAISNARGWTRKKTALITGLCGLAHVCSSVLIGMLGIHLSIRLVHLEAFESVRGNIASWLLIAFGFVYLVWGLRRTIKRKHGKKNEEHLASSSTNSNRKSFSQLLPWMLFIVFIFGPCEPLIPLIMFPAANLSIPVMLLAAAIFGIMTIGTMLFMVLLPQFALQKLKVNFIGPYGHVIASMLILICGIGIQFLGL